MSTAGLASPVSVAWPQSSRDWTRPTDSLVEHVGRQAIGTRRASDCGRRRRAPMVTMLPPPRTAVRPCRVRGRKSSRVASLARRRDVGGVAAIRQRLSYPKPHRSVLSTVLSFADSRSRGVSCGAIQLAGFCSDLQGFAAKGAGLGGKASASGADGSRNGGGSCGTQTQTPQAFMLTAERKWGTEMGTGTDRRDRSPSPFPEYPRQDSNL